MPVNSDVSKTMTSDCTPSKCALRDRFVERDRKRTKKPNDSPRRSVRPPAYSKKSLVSRPTRSSDLHGERRPRAAATPDKTAVVASMRFTATPRSAVRLKTTWLACVRRRSTSRKMRARFAIEAREIAARRCEVRRRISSASTSPARDRGFNALLRAAHRSVGDVEGADLRRQLRKSNVNRHARRLRRAPLAARQRAGDALLGRVPSNPSSSVRSKGDASAVP